MKKYKINIAKELKTKEDIDAFVAEAVEEARGDDDPSILAHTLGIAARARGMMKVSKDTGITRAGLYRTLSFGGNPRVDTLARVAGSFGYRLTLAAV